MKNGYQLKNEAVFSNNRDRHFASCKHSANICKINTWNTDYGVSKTQFGVLFA